MHAVLLAIALLFQSLTYTSHTWSFIGVVTETRQVELMGFPAEVVRVQSADFDAWVIQHMDEDRFEVVLGSSQVGDHVRVYISGAFVSKNGVDWKQCQPADSNYCRLGALYDDGLLALDWNVPLSPSNEFIHLGHPNPSWEQALFWNTEKLIAHDNHATAIVNPGRVSKVPRTSSAGCRKLRKACARPVSMLDPNGTGSISRLAAIPVTRIHSKSRAGRNPELAALSTSRTCSIRIHSDVGRDFLAGDTCRIFLRFVK